MPRDSVLILRGNEVSALLAGKEREVIELVQCAYLAHGRGESSLPHSLFLRFPNDQRNRIIALPAYLGDGFGVAGMKWISSFPDNIERGIERASAVLVLNSCETGRPEAILESSLISAERTAASAALAAHVINGGAALDCAGLIGTGFINCHIARFLSTALPGIRRFLVFDLDGERAKAFGDRVRDALPGVAVESAPDVASVLVSCPLVSFATTAVSPHVDDLSLCPAGATILHISLRDLTVKAILAADNVVDDVEHVLRAQTSVYLAEQSIGSRDFIRCTLAELLAGTAPVKQRRESVTVFSPFGLGVLDVALGQMVMRLALDQGVGTMVESFFPTSGLNRGSFSVEHG